LADDDGRGHYQRYGIYYLQDIGNDALERGNYTDAILAFDAVCQFAPDDVGSWISLGQTYALAGKTADARRAYEEVLELDPTNQDAVNALRRLQLRPHGG